MATKSAYTNYHFRSISLPSTHPISAQFDEHLSRLISSETTSTSSSCISHNLNSVIGLYGCVDELLLLPANQQLINKNCTEKWVDDVLEGSLKLLDVCGVARDALMQTKECIQGIQSVVRRRCSGELSLAKQVTEYMDARKKVKKALRQCLKSMKTADSDDKSSATVGFMLKDVEAITADVFKCLLSYIAGEKMVTKKTGLSLVARLVHQVSDNDQVASAGEFEEVDALLLSLISRKKSGIDMKQVENAMCQMIKLESEIQELDEELECLFRHLVKTRANFLNILSN